MDRRHQGVGGVDPARGSSEGRLGDPPAERARSGRPADATPTDHSRTSRGAKVATDASAPTDPELTEDLGAEFAFRGDQMEDELESVRREAAEHLDAAQRLQAEFDNYRKRVARDADDAAKRAGQRVVTEMLPALDNLERAVAHVEDGVAGPEFVEGVRMVAQQMLDVFGKEGVERIDPVGAPFDPMEHQSVGQAERDDLPEGTVTEVYQYGYRMYGRVLRPAMVVISTGGRRSEE